MSDEQKLRVLKLDNAMIDLITQMVATVGESGAERADLVLDMTGVDGAPDGEYLVDFAQRHRTLLFRLPVILDCGDIVAVNEDLGLRVSLLQPTAAEGELN